LIPQCDLKAGYEAHRAAIDAAVARVLASGWYILGKEVAAFEATFAAYVGAAHGIGVANGTDALALALRAVGVEPGALVATVSHTAVATVAAVEIVGARPLLVDIEPETGTMDPVSLERALRQAPGRVAAILPVHLYGQAADVAAIADLAERHGAALIEDCAQAHGARLDGRRLGMFGLAGCFSLYPTKNLGALGDGGIVVTSDARVAQNLRELREYGWRERYVSHVAGVNSRLDELQAAILAAKLPALDAENARRAEIAARYDRGLAESGLGLPVRRPGATHVFHQYVVRSADRDGLRERLAAAGIGTNIHYPVPIHLQPAYRGRVALAPGGLPATEAAARAVLSLPMYPQLADADIDRVVAFFREERRLSERR
jgi:dTDP-4-amino-4,6-dideoxygalactose transaminase